MGVLKVQATADPTLLSPYLLSQGRRLGGPSWAWVPGRKFQMGMKQLFLGE